MYGVHTARQQTSLDAAQAAANKKIAARAAQDALTAATFAASVGTPKPATALKTGDEPASSSDATDGNRDTEPAPIGGAAADAADAAPTLASTKVAELQARVIELSQAIQAAMKAREVSKIRGLMGERGSVQRELAALVPE
jgi:hypothetical protein